MTDALNVAVEKAISEAKLARIAAGPITLDDMNDVVRSVAYHKEQREHSAITRGVAFEPDPTIMDEVAVLDALGNFLDACKHQPAKVAARLNKAAGR